MSSDRSVPCGDCVRDRHPGFVVLPADADPSTVAQAFGWEPMGWIYDDGGYTKVTDLEELAHSPGFRPIYAPREGSRHGPVCDGCGYRWDYEKDGPLQQGAKCPGCVEGSSKLGPTRLTPARAELLTELVKRAKPIRVYPERAK